MKEELKPEEYGAARCSMPYCDFCGWHCSVRSKYDLFTNAYYADMDRALRKKAWRIGPGDCLACPRCAELHPKKEPFAWPKISKN